MNYLLSKDRGVTNNSADEKAAIFGKIQQNLQARQRLIDGFWPGDPATLRPSQRMGYDYATKKCVPRHVVTVR